MEVLRGFRHLSGDYFYHKKESGVIWVGVLRDFDLLIRVRQMRQFKLSHFLFSTLPKSVTLWVLVASDTYLGCFVIKRVGD